MINYARAEGMTVMIGCMTETSCAVSAAAHLSPAVDFADLDGNLLISNDLFEGVSVKKGRLVLPNLPGLGLIRLNLFVYIIFFTREKNLYGIYLNGRSISVGFTTMDLLCVKASKLSLL